MPRPSHLNPDDIVRFLQVSHDSAAAGEISRALHLRKSDQRSLFKMLGKLKKRGAIEEVPGGRYRLAGRKSDRGASGAGKSAQPRDESRAAPTSSPERASAHPETLSRDEVRGRLVLHHDG